MCRVQPSGSELQSHHSMDPTCQPLCLWPSETYSVIQTENQNTTNNVVTLNNVVTGELNSLRKFHLGVGLCARLLWTWSSALRLASLVPLTTWPLALQHFCTTLMPRSIMTCFTCSVTFLPHLAVCALNKGPVTTYKSKSFE